MSLSNRLLQGVTATFLSRLVTLAINATILLLLTRVFLDPDEFGLLFLAIAVFAVAVLCSTLGIDKSGARYLAEYREGNPGQIPHIVRVSLLLLAGATGTVVIALVLGSGIIASFFDEPDLEPLLVVGAGYVIARVALGYLGLSFQGFGRVPLSATIDIVRKIGEFVFITLLLLLGFSALGALWGFILGMTAGVLLGIVLLIRQLRRYPRADAIEPGLRRRIAEYSVPLTATRSANILYKRVDTLMVGFFLSPAAVGFYELAKQVASAVQAPAGSIGFTIAPTFGEHKSAGDLEPVARVYERSFVYVLLLYLPAVAGIVLLAEPGIRYVFGADYTGAAPVLVVFSGFVLFQAIDKITNDSLDYLGRARERAIGKGVTGVLNFGLNLALIPTIGVVGAAVATVISFGLMVSYNLYLIDTELPLDHRRMIRGTAVTAAIAFGMGVVVYALEPFVDGLVTLFLVVATAGVTWAALTLLTGMVGIDEILEQVRAQLEGL